ncbi:YARHG domain-containing protein [Lachnospiraceae bacterium C1.1]|nr:YARHG domain-containing protein [Lachnospiraceae bacterium C1.1]
MYCKKCGKKLPEGVQFCIRCGQPVNSTSTSEDSNQNKISDYSVSHVEETGNIKTTQKDAIPAREEISDSESIRNEQIVSNNHVTEAEPDIKKSDAPKSVEVEQRDLVKQSEKSDIEEDPEPTDDIGEDGDIKLTAKKRKKKNPLLLVGILLGIVILGGAAAAGYIYARNHSDVATREEFADSMIPVSDEVFDQIKGHYTHEGSSFDIVSKNSMTITKEGAEASPQELSIRGYRKNKNGYFIYVEQSGVKSTFSYKENGDVAYLHADSEPAWDTASSDENNISDFYVRENVDDAEGEVFADESETNNSDEANQDTVSSNDDTENASEDSKESTNSDIDIFNVSANVVWNEIKGHYQDNSGDTVDVDSASGIITRFIVGGNESHTYIENVHSFLGVGDSYLIKVEMDGEKYTYLYTINNGKECLLLGLEDGWDPSIDPYKYVSVQVYVKSSNQANGNAQNGVNSGDYILFDSDKKYYDKATIQSMTKDELRLARNEIYARHGRMFKADDLQSYFNSKSWYKPLYSPDEFDAYGRTMLNEYENANLDLIIEEEKRR